MPDLTDFGPLDDDDPDGTSPPELVTDDEPEPEPERVPATDEWLLNHFTNYFARTYAADIREAGGEVLMPKPKEPKWAAGEEWEFDNVYGVEKPGETGFTVYGAGTAERLSNLLNEYEKRLEPAEREVTP